jgi:hypothetical protein
MPEILIKLIPVFLFFGLGIVLKRTRFADHSNGDFLLKLVFFVTLPSLVLLSLSQTVFTPDKLYLPLANIIINLSCMGATLFVGKFKGVPDKTLGSMLTATMITNNVFMFPFIIVGFGNSGFADAVLFDFGNGLTTATITYLLALKYGSGRGRFNTMFLKLCKSPLSWAFAAGICLSVFSTGLPEPIALFMEGIGRMTSPLILMALGIFFHPRLSELKLVSITILIRAGIGLCVGLGLAHVFGFTGQTFAVVVLCSAAPVGFMTLTFAAIAGLDKEFASKTVSLSILLGIFYVPVLMFWFGV